MKIMRSLILVIAIIVLAAFVIVGSENLSIKLEDYYSEKVEDPKREALHYRNIIYMYWTGKYRRVLVLIEKYNERYGKTSLARGERVHYIKAKTYDALLLPLKAKEEYMAYIEEYPDSEKAEDIRIRLRELQAFN